MTDLVSAQRSSAWGEIMGIVIDCNSYPIKLSAERLKGKFAEPSKINSQELSQYSDMIIRQTESLENIVDEFSKFARMPKINKVNSNLTKILHEIVSLEETANPNITYSMKTRKKDFFCYCDPNLMSQAIINILKNSSESLLLKYKG